MPHHDFIRHPRAVRVRQLLRIILRGCLFVYLCSAFHVVAQYRFDSWTTDNGLPQNSVLAILQTHDGYLWLTTSDGLVRFDGVRFSIFARGAKGLISNRFTALFEDREGMLWIGTEDRGLVRYRDGTFTSYSTEDGLPHYEVTAFREDSEGKLLIRMQDHIAQREGERFVPLLVQYDLPPHQTHAYSSSSHFGSFSFYDANGLHRYEDGRYRTYHSADGLSPAGIIRCYEDQWGDLWVSTKDRRLFRLPSDASRFEEIAIRGGLPNAFIESVYDDRRGSIWLCTSTRGLHLLRDGSLISYEAAQGIAAKNIKCFYLDREGTLWLGTFNEGLYQMSQQSSTSYTEQHGLSVNNIYTVFEDRGGTIWIGSWHGGLNRLKDGVFTHLRRTMGLPSDLVTALCEDREGSLWVGTYDGGLSRLKDGQLTNFTTDNGLAGNAIFAIQQDHAGSLWIGTVKGLNRYQDGAFTTFTTKEGLVHPRVQVIHEDRAGNLWLGTFGGVSRYKDGVFTSITERDGLSSNHVRSIYEDADGTLWVGTYDGGLNRLKDGKITRYTTQDGLYNNGVFTILEDDRANFCMSSNRGIYRVSKKDLNDFAGGKIQTITSIPFDKRDGMPSSECNGGYQPAGWRTRDGKLLFPTQGGLAVVDPEVVKLNTQPPPVVIEDLLLDRQSVPFRNRLEISPGQGNLEIQYTGLSFIKPNSIKFRYKLTGLDDKWVEAGTRRAAYYPYLPPGEYTFTVIAANSDGVWNTQGATIKIIVHPPFWRTWWFMILVALGVVGVANLVYQRRVLLLKRAHATQEAFSRQLIESQERERKRIAAELHDSLGQNLLII